MTRDNDVLKRVFARVAVEMGPLLLFFLVSRWHEVLIGTAALMAATALAVAVSWMHERRIPVLPFVGLAFTLVFGGLTLVWKDPLFIKMRPTIYNLTAAGILAGAMAVGRMPLRAVFGGRGLTLPEDAWRVLTWRLVGFLMALAALNEVVWRGFSTEVWVFFKAFMVPPLNVLFVLASWPYVRQRRLGVTPPSPRSAEASPATPGPR